MCPNFTFDRVMNFQLKKALKISINGQKRLYDLIMRKVASLAYLEAVSVSILSVKQAAFVLLYCRWNFQPLTSTPTARRLTAREFWSTSNDPEPLTDGCPGD